MVKLIFIRFSLKREYIFFAQSLHHVSLDVLYQETRIISYIIYYSRIQGFFYLHVLESY